MISGVVATSRESVIVNGDELYEYLDFSKTLLKGILPSAT